MRFSIFILLTGKPCRKWVNIDCKVTKLMPRASPTPKSPIRIIPSICCYMLVNWSTQSSLPIICHFLHHEEWLKQKFILLLKIERPIQHSYIQLVVFVCWLVKKWWLLVSARRYCNRFVCTTYACKEFSVCECGFALLWWCVVVFLKRRCHT